MYALSKKRSTAKSKRLSYVHRVAELSRRGDIDAVTELMKGFFSDKKTHPWDRVYKDIAMYWKSVHPKKAPTETLLLLRDAVFGSLDILSLSIALPNPTHEFLDLFTKEGNWKEGRREVRNRCIELVEKLIKSKKTRYLVLSALKRDGFGFFVDDIEEVELALFRKAKPTIPKKKKELVDLAPLEKTRLGSKFLRDLMIMETQLDKRDDRLPALLEAYDHFLVDQEIDRRSAIPEPIQTEQVTLNGSAVPNDQEERTSPRERVVDEAVQSPLTDFISEKEIEKKKKRKPKKASARKKGRAKKR